MDTHIGLPVFQKSLGEKYSISALEHNETLEKSKSWLGTYRPILLIFGYITTVSIIAGASDADFNWMRAMNIFMASFFLTFSFFKMLDLNGFAESYAMYDIVAKKWNGWGYVYTFTELALGIAFLTGFNLILTNSLTFITMTISIIDVLQSVLSKSKIKCACLGNVFNLPMSTITIIEDGLMIAMSGVMLVMFLLWQ